jgi:hypothetical protein
VSSRRSASVVIALAVASLAVTSLGAMVASSELLVEAVDRPARRRLDPLVLDLGSVGTIQAELPRDARAGRPPARRPPPADPPPPRRREPAASPPTADRDDGSGGLVVVVHSQVVKKIVVRNPVFHPPPLPPPLPPDPRPLPRWPRRPWATHPRQPRHHPPCSDGRWRWKDHDDDRRHRWTDERSARRGGRQGRPDPPRDSPDR